MSSDDYFDDDSLDPAILEQIDAIESEFITRHKDPSPPPQPLKPVQRDASSDYEDSFNFDEAALARLDDVEAGHYGHIEPIAGPSRHRSSSSARPVQTTLFGDVLPNSPNKRKFTTKTSTQASKTASRNPFGQHAKQTKKWDHTAFAKTGLKSGKSKAKSKWGDDEGEEDIEPVQFEQFPAPFVSGAPFFFVSFVPPL
jgi:ATP-dependent DNA helicase MPH1